MSALWVFVPVVGAPVLHAPVLTFDLLKGLKRPLDFGATLGGQRVFGDNKTWRGAIVMLVAVVAAAALLSLWPWYWHRLPDGIHDAGPWVYGALLGLGVVVGELPNSFLKRRLGIAPGAQRRSLGGAVLSLYDQGDFVLAIWVLLLPIWTMSVGQAVIAFVVVTAVHLAINVVGYAVGAHRSDLALPWLRLAACSPRVRWLPARRSRLPCRPRPSASSSATGAARARTREHWL